MQIAKLGLWLVLLLMASGMARAQNIPSDIPDDPESVDEKNDQRLIERHRSLLNGLFVGSNVGMAVPAFNVAVGPTFRLSGGYLMPGGHAIYASIHRYRLRVRESDAAMPARSEPITALAVQYEARLDGMVNGPLGRYLAVAFGAEMLNGAADGFNITVTPKFVLPINRFWSLPLGVTVGGTMITPGPRHLFVEAHIGVRLHLFALMGGGHRQME